MYWKSNPDPSSELLNLLDKENVTLAEVLEQEDVIQECKNDNQKLVDFLSQPEMMAELIDLIITEPAPPSEEVNDADRFKLPHRAAEVLTCAAQGLNEKISSDEGLLARLYGFLEPKDGDKTPSTDEAGDEAAQSGNDAATAAPTSSASAPGYVGPVQPLNPLLASFFSKAFSVLITRKPKQNWYSYQYSCVQVFEFLKKKPLVKDLLRHIGTSAISDLILGLVSCVEGANITQNLLEWLNENRLIESIIELLDPRNDRDIHDNASRLLIELLRVSRDNQYAPMNERVDDPLLATLEAPETVDLLLNVMFRFKGNKGEGDVDDEDIALKSESTLTNGINILLAFLEARKEQAMEAAANHQSAGFSASTFNASNGNFDSPSPEEIARQQRLLAATIQSILPRIQDFTDLLTDPPAKLPILTTAGKLEPPLGSTRLNVAKLVNALLATHFPEVNEKFIQCKTIDILLDLFFKYSLNNFLHAQVEQCMGHVLAFRPIPDSQTSAVPAPPPSSDDEVPLGTSMETYSDTTKDSSEVTTSPDTTTDTSSPGGGTENDAAALTPPDSNSESGSPAKEAEKGDESSPKKAEDSLETPESSASYSSSPDPEMSEAAAALSSPVKDTAKEDEENKETVDKPEGEKGEESMDMTAPLEEGSLEDSMDQSPRPYSNPLLIHVIQNCGLIGRILEAWEESEETDATEPRTKRRKGYMGHLTKMANSLVEHSERAHCQELIKEQLCKLPGGISSEDWDVFVSGKLANTNTRNTIVPVDSYGQTTGVSSSEDDDGEFRDIHFPQDSNLQDIFTDYQMQQMSEHFIDSFGFGSDDLSNDEESSPLANVKRLSNITFGLDDNAADGEDGDENSRQRSPADMFEEVCQQRAATLPAMSGDDITDQEDLWESRTREIHFASQDNDQNATSGDDVAVAQPASDSSSSEDEGEGGSASGAGGVGGAAKARKSSRKRKSDEHQMNVEVTPAVPTGNTPCSPSKSSRGAAVKTEGDENKDKTADTTAATTEATPVAMEVGNPWDADKSTEDKPEKKEEEEKVEVTKPAAEPSATPAPATEEGWANFDSI